MNTNFYIPTAPCYQHIIQSIWQVSGWTAFQTENIIPKGVLEIIFNFSSSIPIEAQLNNRSYTLSNCFINGFNTLPIQMQLPEKQVFFGVIFQPLSIKKIFGAHGSEFSDIPVDLRLLDPGFDSLWHQLAEQDDFNNRVSIFLGWLDNKMIDWQPQEQLMNQFLYSTKQHDVSVNELALSLCYSPRHFQDL